MAHRPSIFLATVRHSYAGGMTIVDAIEEGIRATRVHYSEFVPRYEPELHDLPD